MQPRAVTAPAPSFLRRIFPPAMTIVGLALTAAWVSFLAYGLIGGIVHLFGMAL
jgi:hypothetical protein